MSEYFHFVCRFGTVADHNQAITLPSIKVNKKAFKNIFEYL